MENRKTSMQELFDNLEAIDIAVPNGVRLIFLEKEKEQIKEAFYSGYEDRDKFKHSDDYYNKMYERNGWQGIQYLGEVDNVKIYYDSYHPDQTLTVELNKEQQELVDGAYNNWHKQFEVDPNNFDVDELVKGHRDQCWGYHILEHVKPTSKEYKRGQINAYLEGKADQPFFYLTKEEFINKCKSDTEFSENWKLKIEERELTLEERHKLALPIWKEKYGPLANMMVPTNVDNTPYKIPTKLITITYNDKTIESYK